MKKKKIVIKVDQETADVIHGLIVDIGEYFSGGGPIEPYRPDVGKKLRALQHRLEDALGIGHMYGMEYDEKEENDLIGGSIKMGQSRSFVLAASIALSILITSATLLLVLKLFYH